MTPLVDEMLATTMPFAGLRALIEAGVPRGFALALAGNGDLAVAGCELERDGRFSFGGATRRLILGVRERTCVATASGYLSEWGDLTDLVALSSACEDEWALRLGVADFLGDEWLWRAEMGLLRELRLFATPMAWLRGGGRGVCVLDWSASALGALRGLGPQVTLVVDPGAKAKLQAMLAHGGLPLVAEDRALRQAQGERRRVA